MRNTWATILVYHSLVHLLEKKITSILIQSRKKFNILWINKGIHYLKRPKIILLRQHGFILKIKNLSP